MTSESLFPLPKFGRTRSIKNDRRRKLIRRKPRSRWMATEQLEQRTMLAGDVQIRFEYVDGGQNVVNALTVGEDYTLRTYVQDIRPEPGAVLMAYMDFTYDSNLITVPGPITHGPEFFLNRSGSVTTPGLINEVGGLDTDTFPGGRNPDGTPTNDLAAELLWFSVPFSVQNTVGNLVFTPNPADVGNNGVYVFDETSEVQLDDIMFVGTEVAVNPEELPEVSIAATTNGNEAGPVAGTFTVTQSQATTVDTVVSYSVSGTATSGTDFTALSGTVTIAANQTSATISVPVLGDNLIEADETVTVTLDSITASDPTVSISAANDEATLSILDDDSATVSIAATTQGDETGPVNGLFTVSQSGTSSTDTVVSYTVAGTATSGSDFTPLSGSVTISAGSTSATIAVPVVDDSTIEALESVILTLSTVTAGDAQITVAGAPNNTAQISITDNDAAQVSIAATRNGDEDGPVSAQFTVALTDISSTATTISYTTGGTATSGSDYTIPSGSVTIPAGSLTALIDIPVVDDGTVEMTETLSLTLGTITSGDAQITIDGGADSATVDLLDDDNSAIRIDPTANGDENGPTAGQFTVSQSAPSSQDTVVAYSVTGTATSGSDFTTLSGSVTIPAGSTSAVIDVTVVDDAEIEPSETVIVSLDTITAGVGGMIIDPTSDQATISIADNDSAIVTVAATTNGNEEGPVAGVFTVTQSAASSVDTVIAYTITGTATEGTDFTATSGTVTILAGQTSAIVAIPVIDDSVVEPAEDVTMTLDSITSGNTGVTIGGANSDTLTITDNDAAEVSVEVGANATESANGTINITLSQPSSTDTVVAYTVTGTATPDGDYVALPGTATIPAGQTSVSVTVTVIADDEVEGVETVVVAIDDVTSGNAGVTVAAGATAELEIADDGDSATVSIAGTTNGNEQGPVNGVFTVTQSAISSTDTVIAYTAGGTATEGADYTVLSGSVTIPAGSTSATITIATIDDAEIEGTESVELTLDSITAGQPAITIDSGADTAAINLIDNETPRVRIDAGVDANEEGPANGTFVVTQDIVTESDTIISYTISGGSATSTEDFAALSGTVTITAGNTTGTITISIVDDAMVEGPETLELTINSIVSGDADLEIDTDNDVATISLLDNDSAVVGVTGTANGLEAGPTDGAFTVTLSAASEHDTTIDYTVTGTATAGADYTALSGTVTIAAGLTSATIVVPVLDDNIVEDDETVIVTLDLATNDSGAVTIDGGNASDSITIADDGDSAVVSIETTADGSEEPLTDGHFTVTMTAPSSTDTVISYTLGGTATSGADYASLFGTVTVPAGDTSVMIPVDVIDDTDLEGLETVIITLDAITTGDADISIDTNNNSATVRISDNETPQVRVSAAAPGDEEGPFDGSFTISQTIVTQTDTVITYTITGTATSGDDFTMLSGTATIPTGQTSIEVLVPVIDDNIVEDLETVRLTLDTVTGDQDLVIDEVQSSRQLSILDNDTAVLGVTATANGDESGPVNGEFTFTLSQPSATDTTVAYSVDLGNGNATPDADYTALGGSVTIPAGETSVTVPVVVADDMLAEGTETVIVTLDSITDGLITISLDDAALTATVTIADDDNALVSIAQTADGDETGPVNGQFTVTQSLASEVDTVISYTVTGTATSGDDFTALSGTVTIPAGETSATIDVSVIDDLIVEGSETVIVTLDEVTEGSSAVTIDTNANEATVSIADNDSAEVSLAATADGAELGPVNGQFTVSLSQASSTDTTVTYSLGGTATSGTDYASLFGTVIIPAGQLSAPINVAVIDDAIIEGDETVVVTLTGVSAGAVDLISLSPANVEATVTIDDDEIDTAAVSIAATTNGDENGPVDGQFTVTLNAASATDTVIGYSVAGTATPDADYTALSGTVTIPAGATSATIDVLVIDDTEVEGTETVVVTLTEITAGVTGIGIDSAADSATVEIADDGDGALASIAPGVDGEEVGPVDGSFTVNLTAASSSDTVISYTVTGTATSGSDFTALSGTVSIPAGETSATIAVPTVDDTLVEDNETVVLTLDAITSGDSDVVIDTANDNAEIQLLSDDTALVSIAGTTNGAEEGPVNGQFTVSLSEVSETDTTVSYTVTGTATSGSDFTALSGTVTILAGQASAVINVAVIDDNLREEVETVVVTLDTITAGATAITIDSANDDASINITDNETGLVSIAATTNGNEAGPVNGVFTVTQDGVTDTDTVVSYTVTGTATSGSDFTALSGTVTIPAGQTSATITVPVINDSVIELSETVVVTLAAIDSGSELLSLDAVNGDATISIASDDTGIVSVVPGDDGDETGPADGTFDFNLTNPADRDITVNYTVSGTATSGSDFTALPGSVTIPAGQTSVTISVPVLSDTLIEGDETVVLSITSLNVGGLPITISTIDDEASIDIIDDDFASITIEPGVDGNESTPIDGTFIVRMSQASATATTVSFTVSGTATSGSDFTALSGSVTIPAGQTSATITADVIDDVNVEGTETVTVSLNAITSGTTAGLSIDTNNDSATIDLLDDEVSTNATDPNTATVAFEIAESSVVEATGTATVNVVLSIPSGGTLERAVTVNVSVAGGTATSGSDFTLNTTSVTFAAGSGDGTAQAVTLSIVNDTVNETSETVNLSLDVPGSSAIVLPEGEPSAHVLSILDDSNNGVISGSVYVDGTKDGSRDSFEIGAPGITITLTGTGNGGQTINLVAMTDDNGDFSFTDLPGGTYTLTQEHSDSLHDFDNSLGGNTTGTIDGNSFTGIEVEPGGNVGGFGFGEAGLRTPFANIRYLLASSNYAELFRESIARAKELDGDTAGAEAIRNASVASVVSSGLGTSSSTSAGEGEGEAQAVAASAPAAQTSPAAAPAATKPAVESSADFGDVNGDELPLTQNRLTESEPEPEPVAPPALVGPMPAPAANSGSVNVFDTQFASDDSNDVTDETEEPGQQSVEASSDSQADDLAALLASRPGDQDESSIADAIFGGEDSWLDDELEIEF